VRTLTSFAMALSVMACASADAQQSAAPAPAPCSAPEFRQMDFWVGAWDAYYSADAAAPGGRNVITRAYGGCVVQEDFDGGPEAQGLIGHSVSTYHAPSGRWRQTWVDNQGGYFALVGGPEGDKFVLVSYRLRDNVPVQRMVFEDIRQESFTWRWQSSADAGASWTDSWLIYYRRAAS
jgi:hypothetical protein